MTSIKPYERRGHYIITVLRKQWLWDLHTDPSRHTTEKELAPLPRTVSFLYYVTGNYLQL